MPRIINQLMKPFLQYYAMNFLKTNDYQEKSDKNIQNHIKKVSNTNIGKEMGLEPSSKMDDSPLTFYNYYKQFFEDPKKGDFIYSLEDYVRVVTSGTMSKPKTYLLPKSGMWKNLQLTGMTFLFLGTHDGVKPRYEVGDVIYQNTPGGQFISSFYYDLYEKKDTGWNVQVPDSKLSFQEKVDYFVNHYEEIDTAYMTVTSFLDQIYPKINKPIHLKGFVTQDRAAYFLKDRIKELTGNYPKTIFGSTETMFISLPSIQYPGCFFFDWRVVYPEFIPEKDTVDINQSTLKAPDSICKQDEVEAGNIYQLVATPYLNDLFRYAMPDLLECVAIGDEILGSKMPIFRYFSRSDGILVLHNFTRINEDELFEILRNTGIEFTDFTAVRELDGSREYMNLYIETKEDISKESVSERVNEKLTEYDKDWKDLSNMMQYTPLKVTLLPQGSFNKYLEKRPGIPKIQRINMREEHLKLLLED